MEKTAAAARYAQIVLVPARLKGRKPDRNRGNNPPVRPVRFSAAPVRARRQALIVRVSGRRALAALSSGLARSRGSSVRSVLR